MRFVEEFEVEDDVIYHYGILRRSGRYPWGSGGWGQEAAGGGTETTAQRSKSLLHVVKDLQRQGMSEAEIAKGLGMTTTQLRAAKTIAKAESRAEDAAMARRLKEKGYSNLAIAKRMGLSDGTVKSLLSEGGDAKQQELKNLADMLRNEVDQKGIIDIGAGVENWIGPGISKEKLAVAVAMLEAEGYSVQNFEIEAVGTGLPIKRKVIGPEGMTAHDAFMRRDEVQQIGSITNDFGETYEQLKRPKSINSDRLAINYAETGGTDADGVIYIRPGVDDLSLGGKSYAQVRIAVDDSHYIKGMAIYKDDLPDGVDLMFNTNKSDTGNKLDALKTMATMPDGSVDWDNPFTSAVKRQNSSAVMNIVNEEGDWDDWSKNLSSQFLSKQDTRVAQQQLDALYDRKRAEYERIQSLTNPVVKRRLMEDFGDETDSAAVMLRAASMPGQETKVILPIPTGKMRDNEVYAPTVPDGTRVALVRYPHGGTFEIPELIVNNRNPTARKLLGREPTDAIGITPKVAERLSGADFDGDTVLIIPNDRGLVKSTPALKQLEGFNPKSEYRGYEGMPKMSDRTKGMQMGLASNLITDMTIMGASQDEIARAVKHSMVVIDAQKHNLDYKRSERELGIPALKKKYQRKADGEGVGAATIVSRARSPQYRTPMKLRPASQGGGIDPTTGKRVWVPVTDKFGNVVKNKQQVPLLSITDDAFDLVSEGGGRPIERVYASHSNRLKALANQARKESLSIKPIPYDPQAKRAYANEVATLTAKLNLAEKNAPRERQAQAIANAKVAAQLRANPDRTAQEKKRIAARALVEARIRTGSAKERVSPTDREWEAIQAGAISTNRLQRILRQADMDRIKELATPRTERLMTPTNLTVARSMASRGYTQAEIANHLGVSLTTLKTGLGGD